jgi:hypothetical protein
MATFTPPTTTVSSDDLLFGRYTFPVGQSVLLTDGHYVTTPYPWLGEIRPVGGTDLVEGETWFQGGRTYTVSSAVAAALTADGYTVT